MIIKCPACGSRNALDMLLNDDDATQAVLAAMRISETGKLMVSYLTLFRPEKTVLTMRRVSKILNELQPMIDARKIVFDGVTYEVPLVVWDAALEKVIQQRDLKKLKLPMENHNYLFRVIITELSRREAERIQRGDAKKQAERDANNKHLSELQRQQSEQRQSQLPAPEKGKQSENAKAFKNTVMEMFKAARKQPPLTDQEKDEHLIALQNGKIPPERTMPQRTAEEHLQAAQDLLNEELRKMTEEQRAEYYRRKQEMGKNLREFQQQLDVVH